MNPAPMALCIQMVVTRACPCSPSAGRLHQLHALREVTVPANNRIQISRDDYDDWTDIVELRRLSIKGRTLSVAEALLMKQYERARGGELPAIRQMVRMARENTQERSRRREAQARDEEFALAEKRRARIVQEERRADPALLLLGIAVIEDQQVWRIGGPDDPAYDRQVTGLRADRLASWVVEFARNTGSASHLSRYDWARIERGALDDEESRVWQERKGAILRQMVELRGPAGARFRRGTCPNPRGRPRRIKDGSWPYPYDDFFMEPVELKIDGKTRVLSRLAALMVSLTTRAFKGDAKIEQILAPLLADLMKLRAMGYRGSGIDESERG